MGTKIRGTVKGGNKIGRRLGFPTANLPVSEELAVEDGVWSARVSVAGCVYDGMAFIGYKPRVGGDGSRILEVNIFGFTGDLYGQEIDVELLDFIRPERPFDSLEELRKQLEEDKENILKITR